MLCIVAAKGSLILGLHVRNANVGDWWSSPLEYFDFGETYRADVRYPHEEPDVAIYGGGSISTIIRRWPVTIAWGVGHTARQKPWDEEMQREHRGAAELCDLYFPRDDLPGFDVVPCASCMHSAFDVGLEPKHKVVHYSAARRIDLDDGTAPHMTNESGTIEEAIAFLASGEKVVTSSYHGMYWAGLMGREVEIVSWGSKFHYLPKMNLNECREANRMAYEKVKTLLGI